MLGRMACVWRKSHTAPSCRRHAVFLRFIQWRYALGISGTFNFMLVFQAVNNILMQSTRAAGGFGVSTVQRHARFLRPPSLVREDNWESQTTATKFGQEEETYNIVAVAHGYFGRLICFIWQQPFVALLLVYGPRFWIWFTSSARFSWRSMFRTVNFTNQ